MISNLRTDLKRMGMEDRAARDPRRGRTGPNRPGLPDPGQPVRPVRDRSGDAQRARRRAVRDHSGRGRQIRTRSLRPAGRRGRPERRRPGVRAPGRTEPFEGRAGEIIPAALPELRRERGPFDSDDDLLLAAFYSDQELADLRQASRRAEPSCESASDPLAYLLDGLRSGPAGQTIHVERPGLRLSVVR